MVAVEDQETEVVAEVVVAEVVAEVDLYFVSAFVVVGLQHFVSAFVVDGLQHHMLGCSVLVGYPSFRG